MAKAPKAAAAASTPVPQQAPAEIQGAGDAGGGSDPAAGAEAGSNAVQTSTTPATGEGTPSVPEPVPPAASDAAGTDARGDASQAPPADEPRMITVKILSPVHHDGEEIAIGEELTLLEKQAKALVLAGAAGQPDDD